MDNNEGEYKAVKTLADYYGEIISGYLNIIDELEYVVIDKPERILYINLALHKIFKKIYPKLKKNNFISEIKFEWKIDSLINSLTPIKREKKKDQETNDIYISVIKTPDFSKYKKFIEKREIHINYCLDKIGIISKEIKKETKLR
jgi:hypothetical protein